MINKVNSVVDILVSHGLLEYSQPFWTGNGVPVKTRSGETFIINPGNVESAEWLIRHFCRWCDVKAYLDDYYGFLGNESWTVYLGESYSCWGKAIGRTFGEAVFRAFYYMLTVERPPHPASVTDEEMDKFL